MLLSTKQSNEIRAKKKNWNWVFGYFNVTTFIWVSFSNLFAITISKSSNQSLFNLFKKCSKWKGREQNGGALHKCDWWLSLKSCTFHFFLSLLTISKQCTLECWQFAIATGFTKSKNTFWNSILRRVIEIPFVKF